MKPRGKAQPKRWGPWCRWISGGTVKGRPVQWRERERGGLATVNECQQQYRFTPLRARKAVRR